MSPALSVIISVKNQSSRLALTLAALEAQHGFGQAYEVVVVDDGSTPPWVESPRTLRPYALRVFGTSSGGRRGVPRNRGAREARGDILLFLDADACPSSELLSVHSSAHRSAGERIVLGDCNVIQATERLEDPIRGIYFDGFANTTAQVVPPLLLNPADIRLRGDAVLTPHALKGIYPNSTRLHEAIEGMLNRASTFAWAGVIPHNLSMTRSTFETVGGFDEQLYHFEGWDFGIRAARLCIGFGCAPGARSFHLYHWRAEGAQHANADMATAALEARYPEAGVDAFLNFSAAVGGHPYFPAELNLSNARVFEDSFACPEGRARLRVLSRMWRRPTPLDFWQRAVNCPLREPEGAGQDF